jgi:predicted nucleic acid-binding protein
MKLLYDTNVILDITLRREPYYQDAARIAVLSEKGIMQGYISASAITDIYYVTHKTIKDKKSAMDLLKNVLKTVSVAAVTEDEIFQAMHIDWNDFEDAVQYCAGESITVDYIITRNPDDFAASKIKVLTTKEFLDMITVKKP